MKTYKNEIVGFIVSDIGSFWPTGSDHGAGSDVNTRECDVRFRIGPYSSVAALDKSSNSNMVLPEIKRHILVFFITSGPKDTSGWPKITKLQTI